MIALMLKINDRPIFTAGEPDWHSLHSILSLQKDIRNMGPKMELNVGGLCESENVCSGDSIRWEAQYLQINDEISITIVDTEDVDKPIARLQQKELRQRYDPKFTDEELEKMDLEMYRRLKHKFEK